MKCMDGKRTKQPGSHRCRILALTPQRLNPEGDALHFSHAQLCLLRAALLRSAREMLDLSRIRIHGAVVWINGAEKLRRRSLLAYSREVLGHCRRCVWHDGVWRLRRLLLAMFRRRVGHTLIVLSGHDGTGRQRANRQRRGSRGQARTSSSSSSSQHCGFYTDCQVGWHRGK